MIGHTLAILWNLILPMVGGKQGMPECTKFTDRSVTVQRGTES